MRLFTAVRFPYSQKQNWRAQGTREDMCIPDLSILASHPVSVEHLHLHLQPDTGTYNKVHWSEERETTIYRCQYSSAKH